MTGYTVHTGSTEKFTEGWDRIFGGTGASRTGRKTGTENKKKSAGKSKKTQASKAKGKPSGKRKSSGRKKKQ